MQYRKIAYFSIVRHGTTQVRCHDSLYYCFSVFVLLFISYCFSVFYKLVFVCIQTFYVGHMNYLKLIKLSYAKLIHISRAGLFISSLSISTKFMSPTIRDLKMLERSGFHHNVDLGTLLSKFISDFENLSRKTRERNYKHCVRLFERTIKASNLRLVAKCRH